jgi:hypothetical protein
MAEDSLNIKVTMEHLYASGLKLMQNRFAQASVAISGTLATIGAAMSAVTVEAANVGAELFKWSEITGVNVKQLSRLRDITKQSNGNIEQMFDVLKELNVKMKEAQDGTGAFFENMKHLNVEFEDNQGNLRDTATVFGEVTTALTGLENAALRTAVADELFSDAGTELLPVLIAQKDAIAEVTSGVQDYATAFDDESARAAQEFNENMATMTASAEELRVKIGNQLIPIANSFFDLMIKGSTEIAEKGPETFSEISFEIALLTQELEKNEERLKNAINLTVAETYSLKPLIASQKARIEALRAEKTAITQRDEALRVSAISTAGAARTPGGRGDVQARGQLLAKQEQLAADQAAFMISFEAQLQRDLRNLSQQNLAADEELRQQAIDREIAQFNAAFEIEYQAEIAQNERIGLLQIERNEFAEMKRKEDLDNQIKIDKARIRGQDITKNQSLALLENLNTLAEGKHRTLFDVLKTANIANAIANTYGAANQAMNSGIPYPWNLAAAATTVLAGAANVAVIQSQSFGGGGSAGGAGSSVSTGGSTPVAQIPTDTTQTQEVRPQNIQVYIQNPMGDEDWDQLAEDSILPAFERAADRNVQTVFT